MLMCLDDESDTATEGEEEIRAREIRKQEVCLPIPNISTATTDTGSDTEVIICNPNLVESNTFLTSANKQNNYVINDDGSNSNNNGMNTSKYIENSLNSIDNHSNTIEKNVKNAGVSSNSCPNNMFSSTSSPTENYDVSLNDIIMMNKNENLGSSTSLSNNDLHGKLIFDNKYESEMGNSINSKFKCLETENKFPEISTKNSTDNFETSVNSSIKEKMLIGDSEHLRIINEVEKHNSLLDYVDNSPNKLLNHINENSSNFSFETNDNSVEDCDSFESNILTNSSKSEKTNASKNSKKPIKLSMVTTEPYPKYTPTVEKAIKKYENKQPKKECIVM